MVYTKNIEEAALWAKRGEEVCFVLTKENKWSLFTFCYYQLKHKTLKEFDCIIYNKPKNLLYYLLRFVTLINSKKYTLRYEPDGEF
jgi:hypothetical protein